ncbi:MAG TPA: inositol monophosphatase family protein [Candidatus Saccharimonas sp.]|nr:inositol monophosphatase family protein [Candidatus Saccharimonas sp.]
MKFRTSAIRAVLASMKVVRPYQMGLADISEVQIKDDLSVVTLVDKLSEEAAVRELKADFPHLRVLREESGWSEETTYIQVWFFATVDPVDGTVPLSVGAPTSTVIIALYDRLVRQIVLMVIGQPATGLVWWADQTDCERLAFGLQLDGPPQSVSTCRVWPGSFDQKAVVLIENFRTFTRTVPTEPPTKRLVWSDQGLQGLLSSLQSRMAIQNYGSNGLHHVLVADGDKGDNSPAGLAGGITTAIGGWWDCGGILAVLSAGGAACGYWVTDDRRLERRDPLDPLSYDFVVYANSQRSLDVLCSAVETAFA